MTLLPTGLRAIVIALLLGLGICAPVIALSPAPAFAAGTCTAPANSAAAAGTQVPCTNGNSNATTNAQDCSDFEGGVATCNIRKLGNGLEFFALVVCVAGILVSAALWTSGSKGQNPGQELTGKRGLFVCLGAAFIIGAYPTITTFIAGQASKTDNTGVTTATVPAVVEPGGSSSAAPGP